MTDGGTHPAQPGRTAAPDAPIALAHEQPFHIGEAEFRPATREVRFAGQTAIIEPRVMQFLIALHRAGGAVVSKDDLLRSCWDGRIVGDDAINRIVSRLRGVAGKEAGRQFRIETITKVGYRLLSASGEALDSDSGAPSAGEQGARRPASSLARRSMALAAAGLLMLMIAAGAWWWLRPVPTAAHDMMVRLSGFRALSAGLPAAMSESIDAEIIAAFNVDGLVGVSAAPAAATGIAPAYSLDGTIYRVGEAVRVISRLSNARSGVVLWSSSVDYTADQLTKMPHKVAADVGTVVRCGLSGAATHRAVLPDPVLSNYMHYCQEYWSYGGSKTLRYAQLVVAASPDFSWGWSAVGNGYMQAANAERDNRRAEALRAAGRQAEDRALALDPRNSEALGHKAYLIDQRDWAGKEALFRRAIAAKPLDCGCEHYGFGWHLVRVGRVRAATEQFHAATDMLALWPDSQLAMASALLATDEDRRAGPYIAAAIDLSRKSNLDKELAVSEGAETGDYAAALVALGSPLLQLPGESRAALTAGYAALATGDRRDKAEAVQALVSLPKDQQSDAVVTTLAALGANRAALRIGGQRPLLFWRRSMRGVLDEPDFPAAASALGLMGYWRTSRTRPDVCLTGRPPAFCRTI